MHKSLTCKLLAYRESKLSDFNTKCHALIESTHSNHNRCEFKRVQEEFKFESPAVQP